MLALQLRLSTCDGLQESSVVADVELQVTLTKEFSCFPSACTIIPTLSHNLVLLFCILTLCLGSNLGRSLT